MTRSLPRLQRLLPACLALAALQGLPDRAQAQLAQWTVASGGNGHWYRHVPAISIFEPVGFDTARTAALASSEQGLSGYLATITSAGEQAFITSAFPFLLGFGATGGVWLGASDEAVEGQWRWLDGPEAGQRLRYTDWRATQPVNAPGFEDHDLLQLSIVATSPPTTFGWVSATRSNGAFGYIIEYGSTPPVPEPATGAMLLAGLAGLGWLARRRGAAG